jgi:hypothetical protein
MRLFLREAWSRLPDRGPKFPQWVATLVAETEEDRCPSLLGSTQCDLVRNHKEHDDGKMHTALLPGRGVITWRPDAPSREDIERVERQIAEHAALAPFRL